MKTKKSDLLKAFLFGTVFTTGFIFSTCGVSAAETKHIKSESELVEISGNVNNNVTTYKDVTFVLDNDIALSGNWTPIGNYNSPFQGRFDGNGYKISNLNIKTQNDYVGFFGFVGKDGSIANLTLENVNINAYGIYVGGIAGGLSGKIENCETSGKIFGLYDVGGIAGFVAHGKIAKCESRVDITSGDRGDNIAGIAGRIYGYESKVSSCVNYGNVQGDDGVGGVVALVIYGNVENCENYGAVKGNNLTGDVVGHKFGKNIIAG